MALIAVVRVNEQVKGEHVIHLVGQDEFLVPRAALAGWIRIAADVPAVTLDGESYVSLRSLPTARVRFDEEGLELRIDFPPESFAPQVYAYRESERPKPTRSDDFSALFNYQLGHSGSGNGGRGLSSASLETNIRWREWLLEGQTYHSEGEGATGLVRGMSALSRDDPFRLTRLTLGDFTTALTDLGGGQVLGGISFARAFDLDPYYVQQPTASFRTMVDAPSQVDLYVGDTRIMRQNVGPGPVELGNLSYLTGRRDVRVVVRDVFGRERELSFPFYFADRGLKPGVQDFRYGLGALRHNLGTESADYGPLAFAGAHRVGVNDWLTAGVQAEVTQDLATGGPSVTLRSDNLGVLSLAALASRDQRTDRSGTASFAYYSYQRGPASALFALRRSTRPFVSLASLDGSAPPLEDRTAALSWSFDKAGTVSVSWRDSQPRDQERGKSAMVAYSLPVGRGWMFQTTWRRSTGALDGYEFLASLQYLASRDFTAVASYREDGSSRTVSAQVGNLLPEGEGVGYRVAADVSSTPNGTVRAISPELTYNSRFAVFQGNAVQTSGAGASTTLYNLSARGSLAYVGGIVGLSRPVDDSFAAVRIEPPIADVRVYLNQQEMGRTNGDGTLFLPRLISYVANSVAIDDRDVPIDRAIDERGRTIVPYARSGSVAIFHAPPVRSVSGSLKSPRDGRLAGVEFALITLQVRGKSVEIPTGRDGDFYVENLPEGDYPATVEVAGRACRFVLKIPRSEEPVLRLSEVTICDER